MRPPERSAEPAALRCAHIAAQRCGVTRLAEITQLDVLGVPVFHAVRPLSRALSVHQGKALSADDAKLGALMEAIESDHAERCDPPVARLSYAALPVDERAADLSDFGFRRAGGPGESEPMDWAEAATLGGGRRLWVPFDVVSLDFSRPGDARLDRSSNGLAARFDRDEAIEAALLEVIERDAVAAWQALPPQARAARRLAGSTIPDRWFQALLERTRSAGLILSVYALPAVIATPAFLVELLDLDAVAAARGAVFGSAARRSPDEALRAAALEAAQSRVTAIAGVRDDLLLAGPSGGLGMAPPLPPSIAARGWSEVCASRPLGGGLSEALARAGYPQAAIVDLSTPGADVRVVKAVVPGLGAFERTRREPVGASCH
jgi:ribosomal protein S12 methylthiotransferase accessory factor